MLTIDVWGELLREINFVHFLSISFIFFFSSTLFLFFANNEKVQRKFNWLTWHFLIRQCFSLCICMYVLHISVTYNMQHILEGWSTYVDVKQTNKLFGDTVSPALNETCGQFGHLTRHVCWGKSNKQMPNLRGTLGYLWVCMCVCESLPGLRRTKWSANCQNPSKCVNPARTLGNAAK